jgi:hypothetical protein
MILYCCCVHRNGLMILERDSFNCHLDGAIKR